MKKHLRFIWTLLRMRLSHMMVFRLSFFGGFLADGTLFVVQLLMFSALYGNVDTIGGWGKGEMLLFIGTFSLINAVNMMIYFFGILSIPGKIRTGDMDQYITKPINPLMRITFESIDLGAGVPLTLGSIGIIVYAAQFLPPVTPMRLLAYIALLVLMFVLYYDMELILRTIPFFVISASNIERIEGELLTLCMKIPGVFFQRGFKVLFYTLLPYGIMATLPTQLFTGELGVWGFVYGTGITVVFTVFAFVFWRVGLRHYKSPSS